MILTGGFDGFDVIDSRFWWFWQVVLMVLMFWQQVLMFLMFWQVVLMVLMFWQQVLMILTGGFDGFDDFDRWFWCFDSRFWCFWWFWQLVLMVLMFWQQVLMILTGGFCFWRLYNKWQKVLSFEDAVIRKFPSHPPHPIPAYLGLCCEKLWSASPTNTCSFKTKDQAYISPLTPEAKVRENFKTIKSEYIIYKRVQK